MANQYTHKMPAAVNHKVNNSASVNNMLFVVFPMANQSKLVYFVVLIVPYIGYFC